LTTRVIVVAHVVCSYAVYELAESPDAELEKAKAAAAHVRLRSSSVPANVADPKAAATADGKPMFCDVKALAEKPRAIRPIAARVLSRQRSSFCHYEYLCDSLSCSYEWMC
jgi:hypothetical protein